MLKDTEAKMNGHILLNNHQQKMAISNFHIEIAIFSANYM